MPGQFSTLPLGLLGLFGIKNDGQYPSNLSPILAPQLDMLPWIAGANANQVIFETVATTGVGTFPFPTVVVPSGKCWLFRSCYAGTGNIAAGDNIRFRTVLRRGGGINIFLEEGSEAISSMTDAVGVASVQSFLRPFVLAMPGENLAVKVVKWTSAGNINVTSSAAYLEFPL